MGCANSQQNKKRGVPIGNSLIHLLQANETEAIKKRIDIEPADTFQDCVNFRGDTIAHYICLKNNYELAEYLYNKNPKYFSRRNQYKQLPVDMSTDTRIQKLLGAQALPNEITLKTAQSRKSLPRTQNLSSMFELGNEQQLPVDPIAKGSGSINKINDKVKKSINNKTLNVQQNPEAAMPASETTEVSIEGQASALNNSIRPKRMSNLTKIIRQNIQTKKRQFSIDQ